MKKVILAVILTPLAFSLGVLADETIKPTGWEWQKIGNARQMGYVEGFNAGHFFSMEARHCENTKIPAFQATGVCILYGLTEDTLLDVSTSGTLDAITKFYAMPQNLPVRWDHGVIVSEAMVSGVPIDEKALEVIRREDAKSNVQ